MLFQQISSAAWCYPATKDILPHEGSVKRCQEWLWEKTLGDGRSRAPPGRSGPGSFSQDKTSLMGLTPRTWGHVAMEIKRHGFGCAMKRGALGWLGRFATGPPPSWTNSPCDLTKRTELVETVFWTSLRECTSQWLQVQGTRVLVSYGDKERLGFRTRRPGRIMGLVTGHKSKILLNKGCLVPLCMCVCSRSPGLGCV